MQQQIDRDNFDTTTYYTRRQSVTTIDLPNYEYWFQIVDYTQHAVYVEVARQCNLTKRYHTRGGIHRGHSPRHVVGVPMR